MRFFKCKKHTKKRGDKMATITVSAVMQQTSATLDAAALAAVIAWVKANITDKVPSNATVNITYSIIP